jgi:alkaline phosphatase D
MKLPVPLALAVALLAAASFSASAPAAEIRFAQGVLAGEVTQTSAILQTRLTAVTGLTDGDVPGMAGVGRFVVSENADFTHARLTPWLWATPDKDFILKHQIGGLKSGTVYHFRVLAATETSQAKVGPSGRFRTLPDATAAAPIRFILTSCLNYSFFRDGFGTKMKPYQGPDRDLGYPALEPLRALQPDFCIIDGDCVYYDHPMKTRAQTLPELRRKWHEQYVMPRFSTLFAGVPTYWLKDDHDYRKNDSDPAGDYEPSHELGIATFREQVPVVDPADPQAVTYRTHRMGRDLQLWFVEGRDYRSPNRMPDGPDKSIWGAEQAAWLRRTLRESDATFKILVSPTPLVGPDDLNKKDNHVNPAGFRQEADRFFSWLKEDGIQPGRFFTICGDRHWKFHSVHPTGYEEFSCGALNRENSRLGVAPGGPRSTDPDSLIRQVYTDPEPTGGFLQVAVRPDPAAGGAAIEFTHYNDRGVALYRHGNRVAR